MTTLRIATRNSPLALWQARFVAAELQRRHPGLECPLVAMTTTGDQWLDGRLSTQGGKGLFVKELERALLENVADIAVHSLKDVPMDLPTGLTLVSFLARHDPADALVGAAALDALAPGAIVGTASQRRSMLLKQRRPDLDIRLLRGNVNTRLAKLDAGEYAAIVLAASGLIRLDMAERIGQRLPADWMIPAPGQGILAIEARADDASTTALLAPLDDPASRTAALAERALSRALGGSCALPLAGHCVPGTDGAWHLRAALGLPDGQAVVRAERTEDAATAPETWGQQLATDLRQAGGQHILDQLAASA
ncbi:MAG: hydroxymethylbilane synthase [Oceanococcaceae bacterium]